MQFRWHIDIPFPQYIQKQDANRNGDVSTLFLWYQENSDSNVRNGKRKQRTYKKSNWSETADNLLYKIPLFEYVRKIRNKR